MAKMVDASDRVPELENNHKVDVKNLERRWKILKQWSDDYSLGLRTIIKEWKVISRDQDLVIQWLDPNEEKLSKICEKIHWANVEALKKQIQDLKVTCNVNCFSPKCSFCQKPALNVSLFIS